MSAMTQNVIQGPLLISMGQAKKMLGIHPHTLRRHIKEGTIQAVKIGKRNFVPRDEMDRLLAGKPIEKKSAESVDLSPQGGNGDSKGRENISVGVEMLPKGQIFSLPTGKDWIRALLDALCEADREYGELAEDANAGRPLAVAAKMAFDALNATPFKWAGPHTVIGPDRMKAIEVHHATWRAWRESRNCPPDTPHLSQS